MTLNFFSQNLVAEVPDFKKLICACDSWKGANTLKLAPFREWQVQINFSKFGTSVTKFCEKNSRSLGRGKLVN